MELTALLHPRVFSVVPPGFRDRILRYPQEMKFASLVSAILCALLVTPSASDAADTLASAKPSMTPYNP
jgi:hypothetical protein